MASLFVRYSNPGHFSFIHFLSVVAPIVAGYFTLLETRLLGHWLFG